MESSGRKGPEDVTYMHESYVLRWVLQIVRRGSDLIYGSNRDLSALEMRLG